MQMDFHGIRDQKNVLELTTLSLLIKRKHFGRRVSLPVSLCIKKDLRDSESIDYKNSITANDY